MHISGYKNDDLPCLEILTSWNNIAFLFRDEYTLLIKQSTQAGRCLEDVATELKDAASRFQ
jgi:hypothetical protein